MIKCDVETSFVAPTEVVTQVGFSEFSGILHFEIHSELVYVRVSLPSKQPPKFWMIEDC